MNEETDKKSVLKVGIACNIKRERGTDAEAEFDEPETVTAISNALKTRGHQTVVIEATEHFPQKIEGEKPDIVFNIAEGKIGRNREAHVPAILEYYNVPYTGSDAATLSLALDKALTKQIVHNKGVQTPPYYVIKKGTLSLPAHIPYPVLVKPNAEGSSKGVTDNCVAENAASLKTLIARQMEVYKQDLLAEQYIDGREFTVGVIGNGENLHVFEPMEIVYKKLRGSYKVYSYEMKKNYREYISYECPPKLPARLIKKIKKDAEIVYTALGCFDFARMDFRLSHRGELFFLEINPLPGLAPEYSDFPMLANFNGTNYNDLVNQVLESALSRHGMTINKEK